MDDEDEEDEDEDEDEDDEDEEMKAMMSLCASARVALDHLEMRCHASWSYMAQAPSTQEEEHTERPR